MSIVFFIAMILSMVSLIIVTLFNVAGVSVVIGLFASTLYVAIAIMSHRKNRSDIRFFAFMIAGLTFSLCGDISMALKKDGGLLFLIGVGCFAIAHISYFLGYCSKSAFKWKDILLFLIFFVPNCLLLVLGGFNFGGMKIMVIGYAVIICLMLSKSFSMTGLYSESPRQVVMLIAGSILFYLSDLTLLFFLFYPHAEPLLRQINWMLYYPAQGLLALSFSYAIFEKRKTQKA